MSIIASANEPKIRYKSSSCQISEAKNLIKGRDITLKLCNYNIK